MGYSAPVYSYSQNEQKDFPVFVSQLLLYNENGCVLSLRVRNVIGVIVTGLRIRLRMYDAGGGLIGAKQMEFDGLACVSGSECILPNIIMAKECCSAAAEVELVRSGRYEYSLSEGKVKVVYRREGEEVRIGRRPFHCSFLRSPTYRRFSVLFTLLFVSAVSAAVLILAFV